MQNQPLFSSKVQLHPDAWPSPPYKSGPSSGNFLPGLRISCRWRSAPSSDDPGESSADGFPPKAETDFKSSDTHMS